MFRSTQLFIVAAAFSVLTGCDHGTPWRSGDYAVDWIDDSSKLRLSLDVGDGMTIVRVKPRVIAVGENEEWMVAARHPRGNPSWTQYFYFRKQEDHPNKNADEIVKGPFSKEEFEKLKVELGLPHWSKHF